MSGETAQDGNDGDDKPNVPQSTINCNDDTIDKMKVLDPRKELRMCGLSKNGNKGV